MVILSLPSQIHSPPSFYLAVCLKLWTLIKYISQVSCFLTSSGFGQRKHEQEIKDCEEKVWGIGVIFFLSPFPITTLPNPTVPYIYQVYVFWHCPYPFLTVAPKKWSFIHGFPCKALFPVQILLYQYITPSLCLFRSKGSNHFLLLIIFGCLHLTFWSLVPAHNSVSSSFIKVFS